MSIQAIDTTRPPCHLRIGTAVKTQGSGGTFDHVDPTTGEVDATIPLAGPAEIDEAVAVADEAFQTWRNTRPAQRGRLLFGVTAGHSILVERFGHSTSIKTTRLSKEFDYKAFVALHGDAVLPLFLIREHGAVVPVTADGPPAPQPGDRLVNMVANPTAAEKPR